MHIISRNSNRKCIQQQRLKEKRYARAPPRFNSQCGGEKREGDKNHFFTGLRENGEKAGTQRMQNVRVAFYHFSAVNHTKSEQGRKSAASSVRFGCKGRAMSTETTLCRSLPVSVCVLDSRRAAFPAMIRQAPERRYNLIGGDPANEKRPASAPTQWTLVAQLFFALG